RLSYEDARARLQASPKLVNAAMDSRCATVLILRDALCEESPFIKLITWTSSGSKVGAVSSCS
ncbi:MAG TPA: hypothetical protein VIS99_15615, partial [Terrimicrobiaceae bacterium]